jgi:alanyl-tRNA synthetase
LPVNNGYKKLILGMNSAEIRQHFLSFFASHQHQIVPSAPIVIKNDPTLLFTNAGMNPFKDYFLGNRKSPYSRVTDTQKCLRVSGKHNDLEEVGVDTYHHTMFEMLGNWSFGDYFKKEAIEWSWKLLTEVYGISPDKLYITIFEGDAAENIPKDEEALIEWRKWIAEDRILLGKKKDNFWEMGDTGPCGPCSEIHVDCRLEEERLLVDGATLVNADHPQVIEIWNNVFIQFNRLKNGSLEPLPSKHVDTGMGLERLVRVLQGKQSNYDTDLFTETIAATEKITGKHYQFTDSKKDIAFRVIADHIRAIAFTIADGQLPANTGAGYVIRRILRRAVRYYFSYLDYKQPLLFALMPQLANQFGNVFPELLQQIEFVTKVVKEEELSFLNTLDKGLKKISELIQPELNDKTIKGASAFELLDTYGFPIDLTRLIARENGFEVDELGFEEEMLRQKSRSRAATAIDSDDWIVLEDTNASSFVGYNQTEINTTIVKYRKVKEKGKQSFQVVLKETPFYAESGGQTGDKGWIVIGGNSFLVIDTKKENNLILHILPDFPEEPELNVEAKIDTVLRKSTALHHSATHLLHAALRQVLGNHVAQKGSMVNAETLRFDFSHFAKLSDEEIASIESIVNQKIRENIPVVISEMPKEEALQLGAMALFGEKYGDLVRVVIIDPQFSTELCGGTHVTSTGELGYFTITAESAVAAGVRRIEALCGKPAENFLVDQLTTLKSIRTSFKNPKDLIKSINNLFQENADLKKTAENLENKLLEGISNELLNQIQIINEVQFIGAEVEVSNPDALKKLYFDIKPKMENHLILLVSNIGGKPQVLVGASDGLVDLKKIDAGKIIKENIAPMIKGGGGGQKNLATAGGQDASNLKKIIEIVKSLI